ncbi:hypothetical protein COW36_11030 [bacterium (Candidatus Blackallbacteria) CG17_big_fil_post_rev_8_21_14_2_50_48_46]|uniref:Glycosyltransferase 2-like domain-containing protein n=1 Tax=bacterium (Candidatus Blackallbacteria) CG17_big_fil_post_rev_8_21_14_2_50_48_46 TaxID=2014261 RepID=A0A2M7G4G2_9BACT|nr:MAG: hypothetical protein COW64_18125 [bacterium (Candidatus Blackallbacteria) CG18_big_fil_WC_8_21_14_2_50_49_26]PIW16808.1 MAG: hypothetical protein COW36_11030 [bacterium (Candidatus Blackallbacteria) CG17_big_fil_post_rev_8_21_14_2_50_48_46]PIW48005.1 MAG: hypothetical protein COW20_10745 [bacterium (Candidatus Blackallbacteria) CG13_big_fil_rev_8_21_14_2_50_49_14]
MFNIGVVITTSEGREENLRYCLSALSAQKILPLEVVVVDDGSQRGEETLKGLKFPFPLHYLWRPNDCCLSLSRNLGAHQLQTETLVVIDSDILLNPEALEAYALFLEMKPHWILYGYFGYEPTLFSPSNFYPEREIQWCDKRYVDYRQDTIIPAPNMLKYPHEWAWGGNFALSRKLYQRLKGFDERIKGWGGEDLDFASRAIGQGCEVHFLLDAWAEHQPHPTNQRFHTLSERGHVYTSHYTLSPYPVRILSTPYGLKQLLDKVHHYYLPQTRVQTPN